MCFYAPRLHSPQNSLNKFTTHFLRKITNSKRLRQKDVLKQLLRAGEFFLSDVCSFV